MDREPLGLGEGVGGPDEQDRKDRYARNRNQKPGVARDAVVHGANRRGGRVPVHRTESKEAALSADEA